MADGCVIGVDLGGTKLLAGVVDASLAVHHRSYREARTDGTWALLEQLVAAIDEARIAAPAEVLAVGFGVPGLVEPRSGVVQDSNHVPLRDVALRDLMAERLGLAVVVDNDANAAMVAEWRAGAARGARDAVLLTLGTGIGGGLVVGGELVRGARGAAAELGHIVVDADGPPCPGSCPNHGCLEAFVSGPALGRAGSAAATRDPGGALARALAGGREPSGALVTELAHDGDRGALAAVAAVGAWLGVGIVTLVNVFNPEVVVLGGGAMAAGELLLAPARDVVARRALPVARAGLRIEAARFGAESGMLGAACLALDAAGVALR